MFSKPGRIWDAGRGLGITAQQAGGRLGWDHSSRGGIWSLNVELMIQELPRTQRSPLPSLSTVFFWLLWLSFPAPRVIFFPADCLPDSSHVYNEGESSELIPQQLRAQALCPCPAWAVFPSPNSAPSPQQHWPLLRVTCARCQRWPQLLPLSLAVPGSSWGQSRGGAVPSPCSG